MHHHCDGVFDFDVLERCPPLLQDTNGFWIKDAVNTKLDIVGCELRPVVKLYSLAYRKGPAELVRGFFPGLGNTVLSRQLAIIGATNEEIIDEMLMVLN